MVYLQEMANLKGEHPDVHQRFDDGLPWFEEKKIRSDHRADSDEKQRRAKTRSRDDPSLRNITTGVHAHHTVNVDTAHSFGAAILKSAEGKTSYEHTFRRKDQVITVGKKSSIKIDGDEVQVDPQVLLQRLIIVVQTYELELAFKQKLCSYASSLFDSSLKDSQMAIMAQMWHLQVTPRS